MNNFQISRNAMVKIPRRARLGSGPVTTLFVAEATLAEALKTANGDPSRLEILSDHEIIVWNSREQRNAVNAIRTYTPMASKRPAKSATRSDYIIPDVNTPDTPRKARRRSRA